MKQLITILYIIFLSNSIFSLENFIGFTPDKLIEKLGAPNFVYTERGNRAEEDDVIFFYNDKFYAYFNQNRVWQMRVDQNYKGEVLQLKIGYTSEDVKDLLGAPNQEIEGSLLYRRPDKGYPLILRLYFSNNKLNDIYVYRGDY